MNKFIQMEKNNMETTKTAMVFNENLYNKIYLEKENLIFNHTRQRGDSQLRQALHREDQRLRQRLRELRGIRELPL